MGVKINYKLGQKNYYYVSQILFKIYAEGRFLCLIFELNAIKMMHLSNFRKFLTAVYAATSWLSTNQPKTNKIDANDGQLKLTISE